MGEFDELTDEKFDSYLLEEVVKLGVAWLFALPGVYEIVREELNNAVLEAWLCDHPFTTFTNHFGCSGCGCSWTVTACEVGLEDRRICVDCGYDTAPYFSEEEE